MLKVLKKVEESTVLWDVILCRLEDGYYHDSECTEITNPPSEVLRPKHVCTYVTNMSRPSPALKMETSGSSKTIPYDTATHPRRPQC
jgi:hypothetical protein